jgi:hypothetical protein
VLAGPLLPAPVKVDAQRPCRGRARRPRPRTDPRPRRPQRRHPSGVGSDLPEDPPRSRRRADPAEQPPPDRAGRPGRSHSYPIGQHDDQVTQCRAAVVGMAAPGRTRPRLARRPSSCVNSSRSASSASSTTLAWLQMPCASAATSKRGRVLVACTGRVTLLAGEWDHQAVASSLVGRVPCYLTPISAASTRKSRLGWPCSGGRRLAALGLQQLLALVILGPPFE